MSDLLSEEDIVAAQAALEALADDPGGWATFAVRGVAERGAQAIAALTRSRDEAYARGLEDAAQIAERLGGDRYDPELARRADRRDKDGRATAHIEAQHLRAKTIAAAIRAVRAGAKVT